MRASASLRKLATHWPRYQRQGEFLQPPATSSGAGDENAGYGLRVSGMR